MKKICILAFVMAMYITACNSGNTSLEEKKISKRDYSINKKNAYNDLFLDSTDVENYILKNNIEKELSNRIRSFYNARNYQYAWFSSNGLTEQALGFWSLRNYTGDTSVSRKSLQKTMDDLMTDDSLVVHSHDRVALKAELSLSENFISFTRNTFAKGYVKRKEMERFIPFKKADPLYLADSMLSKKHTDDKYFSDINEPYKLLSEQLSRYIAIARKGGWPAIPRDAKNLKKGTSSPEIVLIKKLLTLTGDIPQQDSSELYNENLVSGIKNFGLRFGFKTNGVLSGVLLKEMNVSVTERVKQILINMNRMRWMPRKPDGRLIVVNIPEFILHMYKEKEKVFDMAVVVGNEGHSTTIFSDKLTTIVFSPFWNLPESIVKKEIMPSIAGNENYLEDHNMEITGQRNGLPVVRQKPGGENSLGKVKFLFPNSFNIYFHDTPAKSLFSKDVRAYSHGCVRLGEPEKLAEYLLRDNSQWTNEKINEAMNSGDEKFVTLKTPVPVFITYCTAWVNEDGKLNFRNDIYGHDADITHKMFD
ncbi:MAG: L,D-transpeptidase family protein [Ginsengibacter sp.]